MTIVIGLMSGTSVDGIDAALVNIVGTDVDLKVELLAGATYPYPDTLSKQILDVCGGAPLSMLEFASLDDAIAQAFAQAALAIQTGYPKAQLIGSHGQTVYHRPPRRLGTRGQGSDAMQDVLSSGSPLGYSLQMGRGAIIAQMTSIPTVSNFRAADIAAGGQGAPLVPKVDVYLLGHPTQSRCIQNIGGIGNLTYIPAVRMGFAGVCGWDTGPGNSLLDLAVQHLTNGEKTYDQDGAWAREGTPCDALVQQWLSQDFFQQIPPKSTGRELFGYDYFKQCLADAQSYDLSPSDLLATLTELTVASIVTSYHKFLPQMPDSIFLGGGGSRNLYLKSRLQAALAPVPVLTTDEVGVSADYKEAIAFAVLAYWRHQGVTGNLPQVTGAVDPVLLGEVHQPHCPQGTNI